MLLRISQKLTKIADYFYKILQIYVVYFLTLRLQTCRIINIQERFQRCEALVETHTKRVAGIKKVLIQNISLFVLFIRLESVYVYRNTSFLSQ